MPKMWLFIGVFALLLAAGCAGEQAPVTHDVATGSAKEQSRPPEGRATPAACISRREADAHWRATARNYKPDESCEIESGNVEDADTPHRAETAEQEVRANPPMTLEEAQRELDPEDDPNTILRRDEDGTWSAVLVSTSHPLPDWVKTSRDLKKWVHSDDR